MDYDHQRIYALAPQEIKSLQETIAAADKEKSELKAKMDRYLSMLQTAKTKLQSMKEINEAAAGKIWTSSLHVSMNYVFF